ncbi:THxN family PEP-CTERM protein [Alteromonas sp. ASW11-130]|uniref:THxN family PEP-CTERM protein n=1 Tax=Alteromonas sp. ASW11-130 TaxID=3015775 RepID=UPI002242AA44|nr:THxN family PEP-CTERM protein [Alteromonas sp. ASW11-130]MCW8092649.1 PEP-CTERM sorting domain-containing protein [Alteromonas sp. ASW11-130]
MKKANLIAAATAIAASTSTFAEPMLITDWNFKNEAGFSSWTSEGSGTNPVTASGSSSDFGPSILSTGSLPDNLCWGDPVTPAGQSCLRINSFVDQNTTQTWDEDGNLVDINGGAPQGSAQTVDRGMDYNAAFRQGAALRHDNYPVTGEFLDTVTIRDGIHLQAVTPAGAEVIAPELEFIVDFWETPNVGLDAEGTCPFGPPSGTPDSVNENGCADVFKIIGFADGEGTDLNVVDSGPGFVDFSVKFKVGGVDASMWHRDYELITRLSGLDVVFDDGQVGFITRERGVNVLNAQFANRAFVVRAIDAPEPSTLAVFAVSLLGLAGFSRRKFK